jgi:hypothetical protein
MSSRSIEYGPVLRLRGRKHHCATKSARSSGGQCPSELQRSPPHQRWSVPQALHQQVHRSGAVVAHGTTAKTYIKHCGAVLAYGTTANTYIKYCGTCTFYVQCKPTTVVACTSYVQC